MVIVEHGDLGSSECDRGFGRGMGMDGKSMARNWKMVYPLRLHRYLIT